MSVTAGGHITQSGLLEAMGASTFTVAAPDSDILLADFANLFGATSFGTSGGGTVRDLGFRNASYNFV